MSSTATARLATEKAVFRPALPLASFGRALPESAMAKLTYSEQLKHPNWQRKRLERLELAGWECEGCGSKDITLHIHHKRYIKGRMAWEYENDELECLCETCHESHHALRERLDKALAAIDCCAIEHVIGYAQGIHWLHVGPDPSARVSVRSWESAQGVAHAFGGLDPNSIIDAVDDKGTVSVEMLHAMREERKWR